jgi:two-component system, chemotaxis family, protein-glutamate methylesterase/glutaminase
MNKIKVLIVDDSALVRKVLTEIFAADPDLEVVGSAADPYVARERIKELSPDVITLDVEMPRMDGLSFLSNLMRLRPTPVVMVSSLTEQGAEVTLEALELGAVDYVTKPQFDVVQGLEAYAEDLCAKVKAAAHARVGGRIVRRQAASEGLERYDAGAVLAAPGAPRRLNTTEKLIAIGASTGGVEALRVVLTELPANSPAVLVVQHIPESFSGAFARRMDGLCAMAVREARDGEPVLPGHCYIGPGNRHLMLVREGARYYCRVVDGPPVNRHRPSVDVLFRSVAIHAGANAVGAILTGMGDDGAQGLLEMHQAGAYTLAQDEATSVVWGMPGEAVRRGAADEQVPLDAVARVLLSHATGAVDASSRAQTLPIGR